MTSSLSLFIIACYSIHSIIKFDIFANIAKKIIKNKCFWCITFCKYLYYSILFVRKSSQMIYMSGYKMIFAKNMNKMFFRTLDNQAIVNKSITDFRKSSY